MLEAALVDTCCVDQLNSQPKTDSDAHYLLRFGFKAALVPDARQLLQLVENVAAVIVADRLHAGVLTSALELIVLQRIVQAPSSLKVL